MFSRFKSIFALLLLVNLTVAVRFSFSIKDVTVGRTRDLTEDDLVLVLASNTGASNNSKSFFLGPIEADQSIRWTNLTQEIDVPADARNISLAFGISNTADATENNYSQFADTIVRGIVEIAVTLPGPHTPVAKLVELALSFFDGNLFNCDGHVAVDNPTYTADQLNGMELNRESCETKEYSLDVPNNCGYQDSTYMVTHCLTRLEAKPTSKALKGGMSLLMGAGMALLAVVCAAL